jgi:uncharacterized protein (DUF433 family)
MEIVTETLGGELYQYVPLGEYVVRALGVCGGRPTFKYTRIEVAGALSRLASGEAMSQIVEGYGGRVSREAMQEAVDIAVGRLLDSLPTMPKATQV